ncbi:hypothetical protein [Streptococcus halichoeri]|nr:hypothetical protein [Streptococcus halichoeri]
MKIVKKKAITTVAALALAGLFGLTQVTTASADTTKWDPTTVDLYRGVIKVLKTRLPHNLTSHQIEEKFAQKTQFQWEQADQDLEDQLSDQALEDLLAYYQKMIKNPNAN